MSSRDRSGRDQLERLGLLNGSSGRGVGRDLARMVWVQTRFESPAAEECDLVVMGGGAAGESRSDRRGQIMGDRLTSIGMHVARYGLVIVLLWIGGMKFTAYEAEGIKRLVANSPLMSWVYRVM